MTNSNHTISSGLRRCKAIAGELAVLDAHLNGATVYNEGSEPTYTFKEVMDKRGDLINEITDLRAKIAIANATTVCGDGMLVHAVQQLAQIKGEIAKIRSLHVAPKERTEVVGWETDYENTDQYGRHPKVKTVTVTVCPFTERQRDGHVATLQEKFSAINAQVEHLNHVTRLP